MISMMAMIERNVHSRTPSLCLFVFLGIPDLDGSIGLIGMMCNGYKGIWRGEGVTVTVAVVVCFLCAKHSNEL